jgi:hypothetical protein
MLLVNVTDSETYGLSFQCKPASCTYGLLFSFMEVDYCFRLVLTLAISHSVSKVIQVSV